MAVKRVRALINGANFPLLYRMAGRAVIDNTDLNARMPGTFYGDAANQDLGVPSLVYLENVLPIARGLQSVGYGLQASGPVSVPKYFDQAITLRDSAENNFLLSPANGANYVLDPKTNVWTSTSPFTFTGSLVTRAYVGGRTFICYEKDRILEYNSGTGTFTTVNLTLPVGTTMTNIRGIGGASNYLLLFTDLEVLWSSPLNVLEFAALDQGAGGQTPEDIKGQITCILPTGGGFIIYGIKNCIAAVYTHNSAAPFIFKEITNSGGVATWERVTGDNNDAGHYAWTTNGLQKITLQRAETMLPEVTDFLVGNETDEWDTATKTVTSRDVAGAFSVKLSFLAGRYLAVSYGESRNSYDYVLMYDTALGRWGKLKIQHCDAFMYPFPTAAGDYTYAQLVGFYSDLGEDTYADLGVVRNIVPPAKRGIAFLQQDGTVYMLATDYAQHSTGVAIFGHYQSDRNSSITLQSLQAEGLKDSPAPVVTILTSESGYGRTATQPAALERTVDGLSTYDLRITAENLDIVLEGAFSLTGLLFDCTRHGPR